jgi:hypothetical protein
MLAGTLKLKFELISSWLYSLPPGEDAVVDDGDIEADWARKSLTSVKSREYRKKTIFTVHNTVCHAESWLDTIKKTVWMSKRRRSLQGLVSRHKLMARMMALHRTIILASMTFAYSDNSVSQNNSDSVRLN